MNSEKIYGQVAADLSNAEMSQMFGMPSLKIRGKAFCGLYGDDMVFKLANPEHDEALGYAGAHLFDPSGKRPMKEWVVVPLGFQKDWLRFAQAALNYVESQIK
ncbi:MAG: hypothetical protein LBI13_10710 [Streptococcaceae bacterium]|jgi:hypothetical protein|nr:hypothetical protein [Streptococcaceae bacterium]